MAVRVDGVEKASPAARGGFAAGDRIDLIDGHPIRDVLDYRFYMTAPRLLIEGETAAGEPFRRTIRKRTYDDLGLLFDEYLMDEQQSCRNRCVFCFIDQLPPGLRETLYFKDDDSRMSFLFGNYITLTNLEDEDIERILAMHISPVNVSVHTMNPALRVSMMKNPRAGEVLRYLPQLAAGGIRINAQLVLCPGLNDGQALRESLEALCALAPQLQSVAVVPVGLTRYRDGLPALRAFTGEEAAAVIDDMDRFGEEMLRQHGQRIFFAADEFYLLAGRAIPSGDHYEDYPQLENGIGLLALLEEEFAAALEDAREACPPQPTRRVTLATGVAAAPFLARMADAAMRVFPELSVAVAPIRNKFFGTSITVAGLVTGGDLQAALADQALGDELLLPAVMLRHEGDLFLDSLSLKELERSLAVPIRTVPNDGYALLDAFLGV